VTIAVVHLVRKRNGLAPLERFLKSYREHPAGAGHELVILFKGFARDGDEQPHEAALAGLMHRSVFVPDRGFDVNAYFKLARGLDYEYFCFLNSYSVILAHEWLAKLRHWIEQEGIGLVGASGSSLSIASGSAAQRERLKGLSPASRWRTRVAEALQDRRPGIWRQRIAVRLLSLAGALRRERDFAPYPNYHLRTNAFLGAKETLRRIVVPAMRLKVSAYRFESGRDSLTNQVLRLGLRVVVVGRDGAAYEPEDWHLSNTFWQSRQENLLVADNQTQAYMAADAAGRRRFAEYAWGTFANPG
jgi:hypothetical protein